MRGKRRYATVKMETTRIIPAHAGQTRGRHGRCRLRPDHPRACGANGMACRLTAGKCGSSPRMRGKHGRVACSLLHCRIIPAHAGQTWLVAVMVIILSDHPRACGANGKISSKTMVRTGSSPRMRGKRRVGHVQHSRARIIPAHAGQTGSASRQRPPAPDHPRACGANSLDSLRGFPTPGSSPRMRGKLRHSG